MTDDASGHLPGTREYRRLQQGLFAAGVATFAQLYSTQAVLPQIARSLQISASTAALTVSMATLGLTLTVVPWSFAADRLGRLRVMILALILATAFGFGAALVPGVRGLLAARFLEGAALGGVPAVALAYINEEIDDAHVARAAATYVTGTSVGGLTGRIIAGPVGDVAPWRTAVLAVVVVAAIAVAILAMLAPPARRFRPTTGEASLRTVNRKLALASRNRPALALYSQAFCLMGGFVAMYNYLGFRLEAAPYHWPASVVSLLFIAYLSGTVSSRAAGAAAGRLGRLRTLLASVAVMAVGTAVTLLHQGWAIVTGLLLTTAGFFAAHSIASGWTPASVPQAPAQGAALYTLAYYLGSTIMGAGAGLAFETYGWAGVALSVLALQAVSLTTAVLGLAGWSRGVVTSRQE